MLFCACQVKPLRPERGAPNVASSDVKTAAERSPKLLGTAGMSVGVQLPSGKRDESRLLAL